MRQYLGYNRFDKKELTEQLNAIYTTEWRLLMNFFLPSTKLVDKYRDRSRIIKRYDRPQIPYQKILKLKAIPRNTKQELEQLFKTLNPFDIQKSVQGNIMELLKQTRPIQQEIKLRKVA